MRMPDTLRRLDGQPPVQGRLMHFQVVDDQPHPSTVGQRILGWIRNLLHRPAPEPVDERESQLRFLERLRPVQAVWDDDPVLEAWWQYSLLPEGTVRIYRYDDIGGFFDVRPDSGEIMIAGELDEPAMKILLDLMRACGWTGPDKQLHVRIDYEDVWKCDHGEVECAFRHILNDRQVINIDRGLVTWRLPDGGRQGEHITCWGGPGQPYMDIQTSAPDMLLIAGRIAETLEWHGPMYGRAPSPIHMMDEVLAEPSF